MEMQGVARRLREDLQKLSIENDIDLFALIREPKEENPRFNKLIFDLLYNYSKIQINNEGLFQKANKQILIDRLFHDGNLSFRERMLNSIIKVYIIDILGVFVSPDRSEFVPNGSECFILPRP